RAMQRVDPLRVRPGKAGVQRRRGLQVLGYEEGADGGGDEDGEDRQRQPPHSGTTATLGTVKSWNASSPRGSCRQSMTRIDPPWQTTSAGSSPARSTSSR